MLSPLYHTKHKKHTVFSDDPKGHLQGNSFFTDLPCLGRLLTCKTVASLTTAVTPQSKGRDSQKTMAPEDC